MQRTAPLALSLAFLAAPAVALAADGAESPQTRRSAPEPASSEPPAKGSEPVPRGPVLVGDFIEIGPAHAGIHSGMSSIELANATPHAITVRLGLGSAKLGPDDKLLVRTEAGAQDFIVTSDELPAGRLQAELQFESGRHYGIIVSLARPRVEAGAKGEEAAEQGGVRTKRGGEKRDGWVDVGRKRKKNRR